MAKSSSSGLEKPTIIERVLDLLPGQYFLKCFAFWIIFGAPGLVLARYLDTFSFREALAIFDVLALQNVVVFSLANFAMQLYAFYGIRYMRLKIVKTVPELEPLAVDRGKPLGEVFGSVSKPLPAVVLGVMFGALSLLSLPGQSQHVVGLLSFIVKVVGFGFAMLSYGTFVWVYMSSIRNLYLFGKVRLQFVSFYEDSHLGMKPLGSASLSFAWVYFFGIGLVFFSFNPVPVPIIVVLLALILLGVVLFFLPLYTVHVKMIEEKRVAEKALRKRLAEVMGRMDSKEESQDDIASMFMLQMLERKVSRISEWPFDTATLSWFSAIVITVLGAVITRYVLAFFGL